MSRLRPQGAACQARQWGNQIIQASAHQLAEAFKTHRPDGAYAPPGQQGGLCAED
jgi:hypothetical protein